MEMQHYDLFITGHFNSVYRYSFSPGILFTCSALLYDSFFYEDVFAQNKEGHIPIKHQMVS